MFYQPIDDMNFHEDFLDKIFDKFDKAFDTIDDSDIDDITKDLYKMNWFDNNIKEYDSVYTGYKVKKPNVVKYMAGYFEEPEEPIKPIVTHIKTEKPKEKCIIKRILNLFYKDKKNE